jgi:hypothetical protein
VCCGQVNRGVAALGDSHRNRDAHPVAEQPAPCSGTWRSPTTKSGVITVAPLQ